MPRGIHGGHKRGDQHHNWKGGGFLYDGYVWLRAQNHPRADGRGYVKRATLVLENKIGRYLETGELAHHKDGNKVNDHPDNLEVETFTSHSHLHHPTGTVRVAPVLFTCAECGKVFERKFHKTRTAPEAAVCSILCRNRRTARMRRSK